jgi:GT2 family glycosyltransferase
VTELVPASVLIPTIGRPQLRACLESLAACDTHPAEVLVVDQSGEDKVAQLAAEFRRLGVRAIPCDGRGISLAMNLGLREAQHDIVLVTHDDCTVPPEWIATGWRLMASDPAKLVSGRVLPVGDPRAVPSTRDDPVPRDFTGEAECYLLFPNNMVVNRSMVLALGGFDERFVMAAEDNDLCYRWLRASHRLLYEPQLVVYHHDIRSHAALERLYVGYWREQGKFYAKHLRRRDPAMLRFLARDIKTGVKNMVGRRLKGRPRWADPRAGMLRGLPAGLLSGWRMFSGEPRA